MKITINNNEWISIEIPLLVRLLIIVNMIKFGMINSFIRGETWRLQANLCIVITMYGISLFLSLSPKKKGFRIIKQIPCSHLTLVRKIFERTKNWKDLYFHEDSKKDFFFFFLNFQITNVNCGYSSQPRIRRFEDRNIKGGRKTKYIESKCGTWCN